MIGHIGNESLHFGLLFFFCICVNESIRACNLSGVEGSVGPSRNRALIVLFIIMNVVRMVVVPFGGKIGIEVGKRDVLIVGNGGKVVVIGAGVTLTGVTVVVAGTGVVVCAVVVGAAVYCNRF